MSRKSKNCLVKIPKLNVKRVSLGLWVGEALRQKGEIQIHFEPVLSPVTCARDKSSRSK